VAKGGEGMKIQILGTGCPKCKKTYERTEQAVRELGICAEIEKIEDLKAIMNFGIMVTPAVAIDGDVKVSGKIPSVDEIKKYISEKK
jgi:small redox-active disulfide protein 2